MELHELQKVEDLNQVWEKSAEKPVLLFKHSTTCPISAGAYDQYKEFLQHTDEPTGNYLVKVIENRDVSNDIEKKTEVKHESPQVFLIKNKEVVWSESHSKITAKTITDAVQKANT